MSYGGASRLLLQCCLIVERKQSFVFFVVYCWLYSVRCGMHLRLLEYSWFGVSGLPQWRVVLVGPQCLPLGSAYQGGGDVR